MVNWLNYKTYISFLLLFFLCFNSFKEKTKVKWGFVGHQKINRVAVFTLPPEMFGFYKEHIEFLTEHAVDPDKRRYAVEGEAPRHYIDVDHYGDGTVNPFDSIPRKWGDAVAKYSEDTLQAYGIVPWHIQVMKFKLQKAFENKNIDLILKYSADIGHYIGDAHVPLHTTENYNGQLTNQKGIHALWESRLVELNAESYDFFVGKSKYINSVLDATWETIQTSHLALDTVLKLELETTDLIKKEEKYSFETRGQQTVQVYSKQFCNAYNNSLNGMVERRMKAAILMIGSVWYTSWVDAGQPDMTLLQNKQPSEQLMKEIEDLENQFKQQHHKGRVCNDNH